MADTGREIAFKRLLGATHHASTSELMRAALFLEFARGVREGKTKQRHQGRRAQAQSWRKDAPGTWGA